MVQRFPHQPIWQDITNWWIFSFLCIIDSTWFNVSIHLFWVNYWFWRLWFRGWWCGWGIRLLLALTVSQCLFSSGCLPPGQWLSYLYSGTFIRLWDSVILKITIKHLWNHDNSQFKKENSSDADQSEKKTEIYQNSVIHQSLYKIRIQLTCLWYRCIFILFLINLLKINAGKRIVSWDAVLSKLL